MDADETHVEPRRLLAFAERFLAKPDGAGEAVLAIEKAGDGPIRARFTATGRDAEEAFLNPQTALV